MNTNIKFSKRSKPSKPGWYSCVIDKIYTRKGKLFIRVKKVRRVA